MTLMTIATIIVTILVITMFGIGKSSWVSIPCRDNIKCGIFID